jgi:hypothetical protein
MTEVITIYRSTENGVDSYGNPTVTTTEIKHRALVAEGTAGTLSEASRTPSDATCSLYMASGTEVLPTDQFEVRGAMWLFDGSQDFRQVFVSGPAGVVVHLRKRRG